MRSVLVAGWLVLCASVLPAQAAIPIDDFSTFQSVSQACANIGTPATSTVIGGGILGGERDVRLDITSCPGVGDLQVLVTSYFHSADAGVRGTSLAAWDGMDGDGLLVDPTGLGGIDLTEGGTQDALQVLIQQADLNSVLVFEVYTDGANSSTYTLNLVGGAFNTDLVIPYGSFSPNLGAGADFTNVGAITMLIDGTLVSSLDVIIDFLGTSSTLTAEKTGALFLDSDDDGLIEAGETIRYTITITNPDDDNDATAEGVIFTDTPDPNTNLVVGSVTSSQGSVTTGNGGGDTDVTVDIGDIVDGGVVVITFDVVVKPGVTDIVCNQGFVSNALERLLGIGLNLPTDDPNTPEPNDPTCLPIAYCGDGIFDPTDEECDDGNNIDTDECTNACTNAICGDGIVQEGVEECDDGNGIDTDECTNSCTTAECGDGIVQEGVEQCDDGNMNDNDDCSNNCTQGCGNGIVNTGEQCDDGNMNDNDDCSNNCTQGCGNGIVNTGEQCDDGNMNDNDDCSNDCTQGCGNGIVNTGEQCDDGNMNDNDDCSNNCTQGCGNGIVNTGEECDDGNHDNTDGCTHDCMTARCGDGFVQAGVEECDDGNMNDNDDCSNNCTTGCGNGIVNTGEQCDDGNMVNDDGCTNACTTPRCGDGILQPGEQCDDGNNVGGDNCSPTCTIEICGNGILDPNEVCDGAANAACESGVCLPDCTCESVSGLCGNGILDDGEQCDGAANEACEGGFCRPDCTCSSEIPTVSEWGLAILALLLLTVAKLRFTERQTA